MSTKSLEDKFSQDIDAYLAGIENNHELAPQEYQELLELSKDYIDMDYSKNSNKEAVRHRTFKKIRSYNRFLPWKKVNKIKQLSPIVAAMAVICILSISLIQPSFAQNALEKIIKTVNLGYITAMQFEPQTTPLAIPDELKGKVFDENGAPIEVFSETYTGKIYTASGEEIVAFANGEPVTESDMEGKKLVIRDSNDLSKYTCFEVILPSYLPQGYQFDRAELYKNEAGTVSDKYISLYFTSSNTKHYIYMQQRYADEETAYSIATDGKVEEIKINGNKAILSNGRSIDWESNMVLYYLSGRGELTKSELIKIAESIKY